MPVLETTNVAELIVHLARAAGAHFVCPLPGTATEEDVIMARPLCELIDGVLVVESHGILGESRLAVLLGYYVETYLDSNDIGFTLGEGGMQRLEYGQVRIPDLSVYLWVRFPNRELTMEQILDKVADLCVEVLSPKNTKKEMDRKRREYFAAGATLVWIVDPKRTVEVFTAPDQSTVLDETQTLAGGTVLPGFKLAIADWFARAGKRIGS